MRYEQKIYPASHWDRVSWFSSPLSPFNYFDLGALSNPPYPFRLASPHPFRRANGSHRHLRFVSFRSVSHGRPSPMQEESAGREAERFRIGAEPNWSVGNLAVRWLKRDRLESCCSVVEFVFYLAVFVRRADFRRRYLFDQRSANDLINPRKAWCSNHRCASVGRAVTSRERKIITVTIVSCLLPHSLLRCTLRENLLLFPLYPAFPRFLPCSAAVCPSCRKIPTNVATFADYAAK